MIHEPKLRCHIKKWLHFTPKTRQKRTKNKLKSKNTPETQQTILQLKYPYKSHLRTELSPNNWRYDSINGHFLNIWNTETFAYFTSMYSNGKSRRKRRLDSFHLLQNTTYVLILRKYVVFILVRINVSFPSLRLNVSFRHTMSKKVWKFFFEGWNSFFGWKEAGDFIPSGTERSEVSEV